MKQIEILFRAWDGKKMEYDVERNGQFGFYLKNFNCQQFTGLKDRSGKNIYEGDLFEIIYGDMKSMLGCVGGKTQRGIGIVVKNNGCFMLKHNNPLDGECYSLLFEFLKKSEKEIIGNVYENKELLSQTSAGC